jgi:cell division protein FtsB
MAKYSQSKIHKNQTRFSLKKIITNPKLFFLVTLLILIAILIPTAKNYIQRKSIEQEIESMKQEIEEFDKSNRELADMMAYLSSNEALEDKARTSFGLKKEGESVLVIKEETKEINNNITASSSLDEKKPSRLNQWYNYFFE